jgi:thiamine transport system substrate-binding protein
MTEPARPTRTRPARPTLAAIVAIGLVCGIASPHDGVRASGDDPDDVTLITHDSFPTEGTALNDALDQFSGATGIEVEILRAGDAGTMVTKAVLTAGNPEGDVLYGVDNTNLSRAVDGEVFEPYVAAGIEAIPADLVALAPGGEVTPIDFGDVCVNYDIEWFDDHGLTPPTDLRSLADPAYADLLVVQNPASSSPGLAFLLATIAAFGEDGWVAFWEDLVANGVEVVDDWNGAYYERFSGTGGGDRPLVVSYGSSPPFEVIYADPPVDEPTTGALAATCFRQVEFAGVLAGTDSPDEARRLVDFLISDEFQATIALDLFVFPANDRVALPPEIAEFSVIPDDPLSLDPAAIADHREDWIETWTDTVLR